MAMRRAGAACALVALAGACAPRPAPAPAAREAGTRVVRAVRELRGAISPRARRNVLARLRADAAEWSAAVGSVLRSPRHPAFAEAAELARELPVPAAAEVLLRQAEDSGAPHRALALRAAHAIAPLPAEVLVPFLSEGDPAVCCAALAAFAGRSDVPFAMVARLLDADDPEVAAAAAAALPAVLDREQVAVLCRVQFASEPAAVAAITELGKRALPPELLARWLQRLPVETPPVQRAILGAALARPQRIPREPLLALVRASGSEEVRAAALHALLAGRALDAVELRALAGADDGAVRLLCAAGLLELGERDGAVLLHRLAFPGEEQLDGLAVAARQALSAAADLPLHRGEAAFAAWCHEPGPLRVRASPVATVAGVLRSCVPDP